MPSNELAFLSATELLRLYGKKELSPVTHVAKLKE